MQLNRTLVLIFASVVTALVVAAFSAAVVGYAQQAAPTQLQPPPGAPQPAKKPVAAKPHAKPQAQTQPPAAAAAAQQPAAGQQQATVFDDHARQANITTCASLFGTLGRGVTVNSTYTAKSQWDSRAGNVHSVQSLVALSQPAPNNTTLPAAGVVFAAPVGSGCEGNLVRITPNPQSCSAVAAELAKLNGQSSALGELSTLTLPNGAQVMLIPVGNACVAVTALRIAG
ncbi:hypothetical protein CI1B_75670 [Bradyrhizobium ivorense]|uniref:Uncharacterized protein n=1 Tax=Bradyrhizobium ivorense TaxID=2511166 RepID=A0A508TXH5_9BRAD|nr:hypothetical protein [Bradyrhizobium ivorense]VIO78892.1 hypothetical protein CI1B_75670 [Bradyrhizobium ivorense]